MKLASERGMNRYILSNPQRRGKNVKLPHVLKIINPIDKETNFDLELSNYWNCDSYMMMDIIGTIFLTKLYKDIPRNPLDPYIIKNQATFKNEKDFNNLNNNGNPYLQLCIDDYTLFKDFPIFKKYSSGYVYNILKNISECKISSEYVFRAFNKEEKVTFEDIKINTIKEQSFFDLDVKNIEVGKNGNVYTRKYRLNFNDQIGFCFLNNLSVINIDWFPLEFYSLPESTQFLGRLIYGSKKRINTYLLKELKILLSLGSYLITAELKESLKNSLLELKELNMISGFEFSRRRFEYVAIEKRFYPNKNKEN